MFRFMGEDETTPIQCTPLNILLKTDFYHHLDAVTECNPFVNVETTGAIACSKEPVSDKVREHLGEPKCEEVTIDVAGDKEYVFEVWQVPKEKFTCLN